MPKTAAARKFNRDLIGYGPNPPDPKRPNGARLAVNFVMNYEEGSEPSIQDGETYFEAGLTETHGLGQGVNTRDLVVAEGGFLCDSDSFNVELPCWGP